MSRRKQSNPKPIKRLSDGEDGEDEMEDKISAKEDVDNGEPENQPESSTELCADETKVKSNDEHAVSNQVEPVLKIKCEISGNEDNTETFLEKQNDEQIIQSEKSLNFPNDILLFKKLDEIDSVQTGREYIVCTAIPLPKSSGLGPFSGELVSLSSIKQGDLVLQAQAENGETQFVRVLDQTGSWLSQLRPAPSEASKNCRVHFQGGRIWCDIVSDVDAQSELMASFTIGSDSEGGEQTSPVEITNENAEIKIKSEIKEEFAQEKPSASLKETTLITTPPKPQNNHAALLYGCPFCCVRFSSARTLEGHLTYYCSKKPVDFMAVPEVHDGRKTEEQMDDSEPETKPCSPTGSSSERDQKVDKSDSSSEHAAELDSPMAKSVKTGEIYKCPFCSYTADKVSSLNRHKRIHNRGNNPDLVKCALPIPKNETYCKDCNIQFSSLSTYKCHREYYCSKRSLSVDSVAGSGSDSSPSPRTVNASPVGANSVLFGDSLSTLKPDDLKKVINVTSGSVMTGQTRVLLAPPILAPNGVGDMTLGLPTVIVQPIVAASSALAAHQNSVKPNKMNKTITSAEQPLDLSTPRKEEKTESIEETRSDSAKNISVKTADTIKPKEEKKTPKSSPKIQSPNTPISESSKSPRTSDTISPSAQQSLPEMPPLMSVHQLPYMCGKPIPPMLQSVSKCSECNIVFYKHENYLIHKKHYCSSRRGKMESPEKFDTESSSDSFTHTNTPAPRQLRSTVRETLVKREAETPDKESVKSLSPDLKSPRTENKVLDEVVYKYYCIPCKIKFSSSSTLKAHKEFYCPNRKESDKSFVVKKTLEDIGNSQKETDEGIYKCERCDCVFVSGRLLKLHFCTGISSHTPLLRCPYCEFVTQVESRISEHMKVHMPNKVYRCTLCRYRGNTVRGMRMHGKMHVDNGEDFTDENMIEIEEPPLIPVKLNNASENRPVDIETELIRLKNEPYKRRRSRKSFEKSEHCGTVTKMCVFCGQTFNDLTSFSLHLKVHEMIALQAVTARNVKCQYCEDVLDTFDDLMQHIQVKHQDKIVSEQSSPSSQGQSSRSNSRSSLSNSRPGSVDQNDFNNSVNQKEKSNSYSVKFESEPSSNFDCKQNGETIANNGPFDQISVKQEPMDCSNQRGVSSPKCEPGEYDTIVEIEQSAERTHPSKKRSTSSSSSESRSSNSSEHLKLSPKILLTNGEQSKSPKIKTESSINGAHTPVNVPVFDPQHLVPYYQLLPNMQGLSRLVSVSLQNSSSPARSEKPTAKYCTHCDIKFTYQSSYLAHKKYYCSARPSTDEQTSTPV